LFFVLFASVAAKNVLEISAASWNVGLFSWNDPTAVLAVLPKNYNVLVLEEVWSRDVALQIISMFKKTHPYSIIAPSFQEANTGCLASNPQCAYLGMEPNCSISLFEDAIFCLQEMGIPTSTAWLENIPPGQCLDVLEYLLAVDPTCAICLNNELHQLPDGSAAYGAVETCATWQGRTYDFNGFPGVVFLSRNPITSYTLTNPVSFLVRRVIINAKIEGLVYSASHYPWDLGIPAPFAQPVFDLQPVFSQIQINDGADVLLGDFNSGPDYQPDAFNLLSTRYTLLTGNAYTYCPVEISSNFECSVQDEQPSQIDHVWVNSPWKVKTSDYTRFNVVPLLSDHVGIAANGKITNGRDDE